MRAGLGVLARHPAVPRAGALVAHTVGILRGCGLSVAHVPLADNPHHGEVRPQNLSRKQIRDVARVLADSCEKLVEVDVDEVQRQVEVASSRRA